MRTANSMRWLLALAAAVCVSADEGNAGVVPGGNTIEVNALNLNAPISFEVETTPAPTTERTKKPSTPTTTTTTEETVAPTPATDGSVDNGNTVGGVVTCAFRYSMPMASNLADELERFAAASKTNTPAKTPKASSATGSSSGSSETESSGSGTAPTPVPVPEPVDGEPTPTPTTKAPRTPRTPTTTAPTGSGDGTGLRRQLQTDAGETTPATPTPTTKTPTPTTTKRPVATPVPTTSKPPSTPVPSDGSTTEEPTPTETPTPTPSEETSSDSSGSADAPSTPTPTVITGEFTCDASFYGAWSTLGLTCGDEPLDVAQAVAQSQCLIYGGVQDLVVDINLCMSVCKFPKCANGTWDYEAEDGFTSDVYSTLDFGSFMSAVGKSDLLDSGVATTLSSLEFQTDRQCAYASEASFAACQCENLLIPGSKSNSSTLPPALQPPVDKGLADGDHWADGLKKTGIDKAGISAAAIGTSAAVVSVAAGTVMSVAGSVMGTSAGVASGVSATASLGLAMAAVDLCQFSVMINQMNLDATPRLLQEMGKRMAPATFGFLPYGKVEKPRNETGRRLSDATNTTELSGMERYSDLIGVQVDKLFYLTLAGVMALCVAPFVLCLVLVVLASPFVKDARQFAKTWFDKSVGGLMMILILSEYVVGVTATFQICYLVKYDKIDAGFYLAIFALVFFAIGTILFGIYVVKQHEDELRDLGTKHHFEKRVHARYGPLYDEYSFESRYFFAPKLMMALLCGVTTGLIFLPGIYQVVSLLVIHVAFLMYLEVKRPFPQAFVQKTSSFVVIIKISALFLTLFMMTSVMAGDIPLDLRQGVGFAIIGLQVLVLVCLMIRQMYIFYITWKLKREDDEKKETEAQTRSFQPLGSSIDGMYPHNNNQSRPQENVAILDGGRASTPIQHQHQQGYSPFDPTPKVQYHGHRGQPEPVQAMYQQPKLRGLQAQPQQQQYQHQPMQRTHTVVRHDDPTPSHNYRRHQEIDL